jgi:putative ABC transport system substrate-binding protein
MRRREFLTVLSGLAATRSLPARAQQPFPVVGFLGPTSADVFADRITAFRQGLEQSGHAEGRNVAIEYRWAQGRVEWLLALVIELASRPVHVIAASELSAARAAQQATGTTPVIFFVGENPVGLVTSLNRPGGNITGVTTLNAEVGPKRLELAHELASKTTTIAVLINPSGPNAGVLTNEVEAVAHSLGREVRILHASSEAEFDRVFAELQNLQPVVLVVTLDAILIRWNAQLAGLALRHKVPAIFQYRSFVAAGGLMSYGGDFVDSYRQFGVYVGRVLKGENPAELPVQQSTKVELLINLKTAKALNLTVPPSLLARADEVIE